MSRDYILSAREEARLAAWHRQAQMQREQGSKEGPCVTISREFGCQAYPLAEELVRQLGEPWVVIDKGILEVAAKASGFSIDQIEKSRDTPPVLKAIFAMFLDGSRAEETEVFEHLRTAIRKFAASGHCVIVGSGGVFAARDVSDAFHLRLVASYEFRLNKIMKSRGMDEKQARDFIDLHQKQRDDFLYRLAGIRLDDPLCYHLILNNALLTPAHMATLVKTGLQQLAIIS